MGSISRTESLNLIQCRKHSCITRNENLIYYWSYFKGDWVRVLDWAYCISNRYSHTDVIIDLGGSESDRLQVKIVDLYYLDKSSEKTLKEASSINTYTTEKIENEHKRKELLYEKELRVMLFDITDRILKEADKGNFYVFVEGNWRGIQDNAIERKVMRELVDKGYRIEPSLGVVSSGDDRHQIWKRGMKIYWDMKEQEPQYQNDMCWR